MKKILNLAVLCFCGLGAYAGENGQDISTQEETPLGGYIDENGKFVPVPFGPYFPSDEKSSDEKPEQEIGEKSL